MAQQSNLPPKLTEHTPWEESKRPIWLSTHFMLRRNANNYRFPHKLDDGQSSQIRDILSNQIHSASLLKSPQIISGEDLSPTDREYLFEHFLVLEGLDLHTKGQAAIIDDSLQFFGLINHGDHLALQVVENSKNWEGAWRLLNSLEEQLGSSLDYAFSDKFGFLTSDPCHCGTGLIVQVFMHLPAIMQMGGAKKAFEEELDPNIFPREMGGNNSEFIGDLVILQNKYSIGLTEDTLLSSLHASATRLQKAEETLRHHISETNHTEMKDKVCRAYGLLSHSYKLETKEVLSALSMIKLGLHLKWISNISDQKLNEIFFKCRRAHLLYSKDPLPQEDIPHERATYLNESLKDVKIYI